MCLIISAFTNAVDPNDPRVGIAEISTQFPGFESDIIYIENELITLLNGQLEPFSIVTLAVDDRVFSYTGTYALRRQGQLFLDRIDSSTTPLIDKDTTRIQSYSFSTGDEYLVVKKSRTYSKEFYQNDGYHIYKVATGRYFHLFNQSLNMNAFHFSPNKTSVIFLAQFKDESKWYLVTTKIDGTNPVILSTFHPESEMPRFISVTDDAL